KYGSLAVSSYEAGTADGMNEKGLVMNGLYLVESDYGKPDSRPTMSIMTYGQYVLDNFASVAEAVDGLSSDSFRVIAPVLPNGRGATMHMSLSDPTGDSAIFEWLDGMLAGRKAQQLSFELCKPRRCGWNVESFESHAAANGLGSYCFISFGRELLPIAVGPSLSLPLI